VSGDGRLAVRSACLTCLSSVLAAELGPSGALRGAYGVRAFRELLLPMLDVVPLDAEAALTADQLQWVRETGLSVLSTLERAFCSAYEQLSELLDDVIALLVRCLQQRQHGGLAHVAAESLLHLVRETGASFSQETWASVCAELKSCFASGDAIVPEVEPAVEAAEGGAPSSSPLLREVSAKVEAEAPPGSGPHELQVLLLSTVYQLLHSMYPSMKIGDVEGLLNCMHGMYDKAHRLLQGTLSGEAASSEAELQEASHLKLESMSFYLQVLLTLFAKLSPDAAVPAKGETPPLSSDAHVLLIASAAEYRLISFCLHVLRDYSRLHEICHGTAPPEDEAALKLAQGLLREFTPNVVMLLHGILKFHDPQFARHLPAFYPLFVDLMHCDSKQVRSVLRELFAQRVGPVLQQQQA